MAFALNIFVIHALGDAISPTLIGLLSDSFGLRTALLTTGGAVALAAAFCFGCGRTIGRDLVNEEESAP